MEFINRFDNFYETMKNSVKEGKINEQEFLMLIQCKAKLMARENREKKILLSKSS